MLPQLMIVRTKSPESLKDLEAAVSLKTGLKTRYKGSDTLIMSGLDADLSLPDGGGVFGEIFGRAELRRIRVLDPKAALAIVSSNGRTLVSEFWGDYLAVVFGPDGALNVIRSPFGSMSAYRIQMEDAEIVASEVGLLIDAGWLAPSVDWDFLAHFMAYPFQRSWRTGFKGVTELPPGSALSLSDRRGATEQGLWSPWSHVKPNIEGPLTSQLKDQARRCVRAWADGRQRLLLELSGGLDSSILAACLWDVQAEVVCVNMVSPARDGDERIFAREVAKKTGLALHEIELEPRGLDLTAPPTIRRPRPGAHALLNSWDAALIDHARDIGADAFVSGGGGDNVFFNTHGSAPAADALLQGALRTWAGAVRDLADLHGCSVWRAGRMSIKRALQPAIEAWRPDVRFLMPAACPREIETHPWLDRQARDLPGKLDHVKALMAVQNYLDCFPRSSHAPILTPLLSQPLVELCLSIPSWEWIQGGQDRSVAREAFRTALPSMIVERRSKGNLAGFAGPAFEAARDQLADHLLGGRLDQAGLLDGSALRAALNELGPPKGSDYFRILQIADVESWARHWS